MDKASPCPVILCATHSVVGYVGNPLINYKNAATLVVFKRNSLDNFRFSKEKVDCTDWFTNVPLGLKASVYSTTGSILLIVFSGTPEEESVAQIGGTLPPKAFVGEDTEGYISMNPLDNHSHFNIRYRYTY